jgi:hypothetical protein
MQITQKSRRRVGKTLKKLLSLTLSLVMVLSLCAVNTFAADGFTIKVDTTALTSLEPGDTFQVPITLSNNPGVAGVAFSVTLDETRLEWDFSEETYDPYGDVPWIIGTLGFDDLTPPFTLSNKFNFNATRNRNNVGTLITLKFKVKDDARPGSASIDLNIDPANDDIFGSDLVNGQLVEGPVVYTLENGSVNIETPIRTVAVTLTAPALGEEPKTTATVSGTGYSGAVQWNPTPGEEFGPGTAYKATITLTATDPTGAPFTNPSITLNGAAVTATTTSNASTIVFEHTFPATLKTPLGVTGATATDRVYDGTTTIAITGATLDGKDETHTVSIQSITGTVASADVGANKPVTVTTVLAGADKDKYTFSEPTGVTVNITPATPTYTVVATKKVRVNSTLDKFLLTSASGSGTGVGGETVAGAITWYSDSSGGTVLTDSDVAGLAAGTTKTFYYRFNPTSDNYINVDGSTQFEIIDKDVQEVTFATPTSVTKTYGDGTFTNKASVDKAYEDAIATTPHGTISYAIDDTDVATINESTGLVTIVGVGTATITATAESTADWAEASNSYTLTVTPKTPVAADFTADLTKKAYTGADQAVTVTSNKTAIIPAEMLTVLYDGEATPLPNAIGDYEISVAVAGDANVVATEVPLGTFTITKVPTSISVDGVPTSSVKVNDTVTLTPKLTPEILDAEITATINGTAAKLDGGKLTVPTTDAGTTIVVFSYAGDEFNDSASKQVSFEVIKNQTGGHDTGLSDPFGKGDDGQLPPGYAPSVPTTPTTPTTPTEPTTPGTDEPGTTPSTPVTSGSSGGASAVVDTTEKVAEVVTPSGETLKTSSVAAAEVIASGSAKEVVSSGSAVAVVTADNTVIAGANSDGSLNSASTVAALESAINDMAEEDFTVTVKVGADVTGISAKAMQKLADAAEAKGVEVKVQAQATNTITGESVGAIQVPVSTDSKKAVSTGIILEDSDIDDAIEELTEQFSQPILGAFKTEQKQSFGAKVTVAVKASSLGIEVEDGTILYAAIKTQDGGVYQVKCLVYKGAINFKTTRAGVVMFSDKPFVS